MTVTLNPFLTIKNERIILKNKLITKQVIHNQVLEAIE